MSANNFIRIEKIENKYHVDECDMDTQQPYSHIGIVGNLEQAVGLAKKAEQMSNNDGYEIEYGIQIR